MKRLYKEGIPLPVFSVGEYRISYGPATGNLYAGRGDRYLGEITSSGIFREYKRVSKKDREAVKALVENPLDVARGAAILLGFEARCPVCGRKLDSKDRLQGIGPKCKEKGRFDKLETRRKKNA